MKHALLFGLLLALASLSPTFGSPVKVATISHHAHHRSLLQEDGPLDTSGSIVATGEPFDATAATATTTSDASRYAPDAPDASVGEPVLEVAASSADVAAAAAAAGPGQRRRNVILAVPGQGYGAAQAVTPAQTTQVTVYEHSNYAGRAGVAGVGDYRQLRPEFNDMISSLRVPAGLKVTLWERVNYAGRGLVITGPVDLADVGPWNFHDITSSIKVESTSGGGGQNPPPPQDYANEILNLVNNARRANGRTALTLESRLQNAAMAHSMDQARMRTMTHTGSDGSTIGTRVTRTGYPWRTVGENVAVGYTSAQSVFNGWWNSAGHRANILNTNFREMGVAFSTGGDGRQYWTQVFGAR